MCEALELGNPSQAVKSHVDADDLQKLEVIDNLGRKQRANHVNESGVYALILGSTKDAAKRFKRWLTTEVLPSIRKTGAYATSGVSNDPLAALPPEHRALVNLMVENAAIKKKQAEQDAAQTAHAESIKRIEARQSAIEEGASYFTVMGYAKLNDIKISLTESAAIGRKASSISKKAGISTEKVRDPRFGEVGSYHESVLKQALAEMLGGT